MRSGGVCASWTHRQVAAQRVCRIQGKAHGWRRNHTLGNDPRASGVQEASVARVPRANR